MSQSIVKKGGGDRRVPKEKKKKIEFRDPEGENCAICLDSLISHPQRLIEWLSCGHCFHNDCVNALQLSNVFDCPLCRQVYTRDYDRQWPPSKRGPPPPPPPPKKRETYRQKFIRREAEFYRDLEFENPRHLDNS